MVGNVTGVRWYEIRQPGGTPVLVQQGTYAPDDSFRWMGSAAMDRAGNIGLGYSLSSASLHPAVHFTGRLAGDALSQMTQGEGSIVEGPGSQTGTLTRWGDYSSLSVDPADNCIGLPPGCWMMKNGSSFRNGRRCGGIGSMRALPRFSRATIAAREVGSSSCASSRSTGSDGIVSDQAVRLKRAPAPKLVAWMLPTSTALGDSTMRSPVATNR